MRKPVYTRMSGWMIDLYSILDCAFTGHEFRPGCHDTQATQVVMTLSMIFYINI